MSRFCETCGAQFAGTDAFCTKCGARRSSTAASAKAGRFCTHCGSSLVAETKFCEKCGETTRTNYPSCGSKIRGKTMGTLLARLYAPSYCPEWMKPAHAIIDSREVRLSCSRSGDGI